LKDNPCSHIRTTYNFLQVFRATTTDNPRMCKQIGFHRCLPTCAW